MRPLGGGSLLKQSDASELLKWTLADERVHVAIPANLERRARAGQYRGGRRSVAVQGASLAVNGSTSPSQPGSSSWTVPTTLGAPRLP